MSWTRFPCRRIGAFAITSAEPNSAVVVRPIAVGRPRRILLVKPSALGDVVHALPIVELLRARFPAASIAWLIAPPFAPIVAGHPCVDEVIAFDRRRFSRGTAGLLDAVGLGRSLADRGFDLAIDLQGLARSALLTYATNAPVRVGFAYAREGAPLAYTDRVAWRGTSERHAVERYLDVAEALGCGRGPIRYRFPVADADRDAVRAMTGDAPFAVLLPGTNWETKKWPIAHYATLAARIDRELGLRVVVAGGKDVVALAQQMTAEVPGAIDLAARTTLPQLVALLGRASLVVANDSGPMHIASALGRPLVTIFGPTNAIRTGPHGRMDAVVRLNVICSPCYSRTCDHTSCMHWLTPDRVFPVVARALA